MNSSGESQHLVKTMIQHTDGSWSKPELHADITRFLGKELVIAVKYPSQNGGQTLVHFHGPIVRINEQDGIVINGSDARGEFAIPPRAYLAEEHRKAIRPTSTGEIIHPDYSTLIDLDGPPRPQGWNRKLDLHNAQ